MSRTVLTLNTDAERRLAISWVTKALPGTRLELRGAKRSLDQNALLWARLTDVSKQVEWYGQKLAPGDWKEMFTASLRKARVVPGIDPGSFVLLGLHTSDMGTEEMSNLLDLIDAFAAEHGVSWSEPKQEAAA